MAPSYDRRYDKVNIHVIAVHVWLICAIVKVKKG